MTNTCVCGCGRTLIDGYAHTDCTEQARGRLKEISELAEPARAVMYRQTATGGTVHSTPGPRDLLDYGAGQRLMTVQIALTGWARAVAEERGRPNWDGTESPDLIIRAAEYLSAHMEWCRHKPWVDEVLREIGDCAAAMRSIVATPAGRVYLGTCGAPAVDREPPDDVYAGCLNSGYCVANWDCHAGKCEPKPPPTCDGDVYGKPGKAAAYCSTCGAAYDQDERRVQVAKLVQGGCYRASQLEHAYGLNAATVRKWAERELITAREQDGQGRPMYRLDEVLAVAASESERLDQARQKRHQRRGAVAGVTPG